MQNTNNNGLRSAVLSDPGAGEFLIEAKSIGKRYQDGRSVLEGVSFNVRRGEWLSVLGKSGSGKTTLINIIAGLDTPDRGEMLVGGVPVHSLDERGRALWRGGNVGFVFQSYHLLPTLTVLENVLLAMDLGGQVPRKNRRERAMTILARLEIEDLRERFPSKLSGGEQQRAAIARAIANDPPLLLADEPTGNLDTRTAASVFEIFRLLVEAGKSIVMVTHDPEAKARADRSIVLSDGCVIDGTAFTRKEAGESASERLPAGELARTEAGV